MSVQLIQSPLSSSRYNALPHIDDINNAAQSHAEALRELLTVIYSHGLDHHLSVHLIHKHFDLADDRVMVYETVHGQNHPDFVLSSPRAPEKCTNLRGLYFKAEGNNMVAYEFTTDQGEDISVHTEFLTAFHGVLVRLGVQDVSALTVKLPEARVLTEFELTALSSTILAEEPHWLPSSEDDQITITDWASSELSLTEGPPGIVQLGCMKTRSGKHHGASCMRTRSGGHYRRDPGPFASPEQDFEVTIGGKVYERDSEAYAIVKRAHDLIDVA